METQCKRPRNPIIIRIDDVCPSMDLEKFYKYVNALKELDVKPLLGVIPLCEDESINYGQVDDFWTMLRQMQEDGYPIAMHGVNHVYCTRAKGLVCDRKMSEFSSISLEEQKEKLLQGKNALAKEGIYTDTFMAPGHSYDRNTLKALKSLGFEYITDGRSKYPYMLEGVKCIPATPAWKLHFSGGILTICLHPSYEAETNLNLVKELLIKEKNRVISFEEAKTIKNRSYFLCRIQEKISMATTRVLTTISRLIKGI